MRVDVPENPSLLQLSKTLRGMRARAAAKECEVHAELCSVAEEGRDEPELRERYDYVAGKFSALNEVVRVVDEWLGCVRNEG